MLTPFPVTGKQLGGAAREVWQQGGVLQLADDMSVLRSVFLSRPQNLLLDIL